MAYPILRTDSFVVIIIMLSFTNIEAVNTISTSRFLWVYFCAFTLAFLAIFSLLFLGYIIIMLHDVEFLHVFIELYILTTLGFSVVAGFIFFVWLLIGVLLGVLLEYLTILRGVSEATQQLCVSCTSRFLDQRDYIFCLALAFSALLGFGRRYGFSFLSFPDIDATDGICPYDCFRSCFHFVHMFSSFHYLKHGTGFPESFHLKFPSLHVGLLFPSAGYLM